MKKILISFFLVVSMLHFQLPLFSQQGAVINNQNNTTNNTISVNPETEDDKQFKRYATYGTIIGSFAVTYYYGAQAWDWGEGGWKWGDEGWFGADTPSGGADKLGHMWSMYVLQRGFTNLFEYTLENDTEALIVATVTSASIGLLIECGDATSSSWGFSPQDLVFDWMGTSLGAVLEYFPTADAFIGYSWEYWPTKDFLEESKGRKKVHVTGDYSGHKYMINFKLAGFKYIGWDIPEFMRYIMLDFGYYTRGYTDYEDPGTEMTRHPYFGVSVNMMEVVKDFFDDSNQNSRLCVGLQQPFKYMHVPLGYEWDYTLHSGKYVQ